MPQRLRTQRGGDAGAGTRVAYNDSMNPISHDREDETLRAKVRWFRTLTPEQRLAHFAEFYTLALTLNPDIADRKDVRPPSERVQIIERPGGR